MYKKIFFGSCLTEYCDHIFNFAVSLAEEHDASLWIYYGLGNTVNDPLKFTEAIKAGEAKVAEACIGWLKARGLTDFKFNVSDGDVVAEMTIPA